MTRLTLLIHLALLSCAFLLPLTTTAHAQTQLGAHYSALALAYPDQTRAGVGAFAVYSPREWIGADVSTTYFFSEPIGGTAWQVLAGPRAGTRVAGLGIFGRVRPGFIRFSERFYAPEVICIAIFPPPESCLASATNLALDIGGTVAASLSRSTVLRLDVGDTLIRYRGIDGGTWKHGLQFVAGLAWQR